MMLCQPLGGFLGDRYSKRHIAALCLLGHGVAMVVLATASGYWLLMLYAVVNGSFVGDSRAYTHGDEGGLLRAEGLCPH